MATPPATTVPVSRPVPRWLKGSLLAALVIGTCWGGAIWYWRANDIEPGGAELVAILLAGPLALLLALGIGRKLAALRASGPAASAQATPVQAAPAQQPVRPLAIVAASVRSPHGASVEELAAAIADNKARADLDEELVDADGFPVMTARSSDAQDPAMQEEISEWLANNGMPELRFTNEQWRALTLANGVVEDMASYAASDLIPAEGEPPMLRLSALLPDGWHDDQRHAAGMWLRHSVTQQGWPPARISVMTDTPSDVHAKRPAALLTQLAREAAAGNAHFAVMVVACASNIDQETVDEWAASESLFTSSRPQGLIPGEGAAGVLITSLHDDMAVEDKALALIDPGAPSDSPVEDNGRAGSKQVSELAERVLKFGALESSNVGMVVADADHRARPTRELMEFVSGTMRQLDGTDDVASVGLATGNCGAVPFMTALALARHHALERDAAVLCISTGNTAGGFAVLIRPAAALS